LLTDYHVIVFVPTGRQCCYHRFLSFGCSKNSIAR